MGCKNNPGKFDCYTNAEPDEPMFVLLGRDPVAPFLVSLWAKIRYGDAEAAFYVFQKMCKTLIPKYDAAPDVDKVAEATDCAMAMREWRRINRP